MASDWRERLFAAIAADPRKDRAIGIAAKLGPNFISQLRGTDKSPPKEPGLDKVLRLCAELQIDPASLFAGTPEIPRATQSADNAEQEALKAKLGDQFAKLLQADPKYQRVVIPLIDGALQSIPSKSRITKTKEKSSSIRT